jgi:hypothetical protein
MPPKAAPIDLQRARELFDQGLTWPDIANTLGVKRTTLLSQLRAIGPLPKRTSQSVPKAPTTPTASALLSTPEGHTSTPEATPPSTPEVHSRIQKTVMPVIHASAPEVHIGIPAAVLDDLQAMLTWWKERQEALQTRGTDSETQRITFHVQRLWIECIRRQADRDGLTITEVVNQAFRNHFERKSP